MAIRIAGRPAVWLAALLLTASLGAQSQTPQQILAELREGNRRFVRGESTNQHSSKSWREKLSQAQHPKAIILGCADSRVPPELLFDQGFGDLFVIRIAGNVVDLDVAASLDYAFLHTGAHLVVVLGHEECGAVTAALEDFTREELSIQFLLKQIAPALATIPAGLSPEERVAAGVRSNVRQSVRELSALPVCAAALKRKELLLVGAVYDLETGEVRLVDPLP